jgi:hypothetical protein
VSEFTLYPDALQRVLNDPAGPVGLFLEEVGLRVESQAKVNASCDRHDPNRAGPAVRSGRMRAGIVPHVELGELGLVLYVTSPLEYSGYVETGTNRSRPFPFMRPALSAV